MTECTKDGVVFSSQGRRRVTADFRGGDISSDAGVLLLREAERGLGLVERLSAAISAAAYVLVEHIRSTALQGTALARAQVTRIRLELFKIGARVLTSVRPIVIHLATACPAKDIFTLAASRLLAASSSPSTS